MNRFAILAAILCIFLLSGCGSEDKENIIPELNGKRRIVAKNMETCQSNLYRMVGNIDDFALDDSVESCELFYSQAVPFLETTKIFRAMTKEQFKAFDKKHDGFQDFFNKAAGINSGVNQICYTFDDISEHKPRRQTKPYKLIRLETQFKELKKNMY